MWPCYISFIILKIERKIILNNYKVIIEYDGTNYHGFAKQPLYNTIQGTLEQVLEKILKEKVTVFGSGRTDAGVHALNQVVNFETKLAIEPISLLKAINSNLPLDIVVKDVETVDNCFHARLSAKKKHYKYIINNRTIKSALNRNREMFCKFPLDFLKMQSAIQNLEGEHDFAGFMNTGSVIKQTIRIIEEATIKKEDGIITIDFVGNGFLYNQVRIMVGTLIEIGRGNLDVDIIEKILENKDRKLAGRTVDPQGLYLVEVEY